MDRHTISWDSPPVRPRHHRRRRIDVSSGLQHVCGCAQPVCTEVDLFVTHGGSHTRVGVRQQHPRQLQLEPCRNHGDAEQCGSHKGKLMSCAFGTPNHKMRRKNGVATCPLHYRIRLGLTPLACKSAWLESQWWLTQRRSNNDAHVRLCTILVSRPRGHGLYCTLC